MNFIGSDFHLNHNRILELCKRPFSTIQEMNDDCIKNINSQVKSTDSLYFLGDFYMGKTVDYQATIASWWNKINCQNVYWLLGNHDHISPNDKHKLNELTCGKFSFIGYYLEFKHERQFVTMMHYPIATWNKCHHGSYMIHGHCHTKSDTPITCRRQDVGYDFTKRWVSSLDEVLKGLESQPFGIHH